jgi:DNA processing protein
VTTAIDPGHLPPRLQKLGWNRQLYVRGELASDGPSVAIVGARAASRIGMDRAHLLARHLGERGVRVVSGGALGIDGAAHRGALAGGGTTTVVLGSGVDVPYPRRHAGLFRDVIEHGGALVSQLPDGTEPRRSTFVQRNPLIAALADVVIVVEANVKSGSLSTAEAGTRLGRIVAAWPGSRGCERLLARGAAIVEGAEDAERLLTGAPRYRQLALVEDPVAREVADAIAGGAAGIDQIVERTGLTVRAVLRALPMLERLK